MISVYAGQTAKASAADGLPAIIAPVNELSHRLRPLVEAPAAVPGMVVVVLLVAAAASEGGYPAVDWYPAALFTLALLACSARMSIIVSTTNRRPFPRSSAPRPASSRAP